MTFYIKQPLVLMSLGPLKVSEKPYRSDSQNGGTQVSDLQAIVKYPEVFHQKSKHNLGTPLDFGTWFYL